MTDFHLLLLKNFYHEPTYGQDELMLRLSDFVRSDQGKPLYVIKGYAGTGKTSIVSALVRSLDQLGRRTVLLAPTGRAAKVLSAYSGKPAFTIHKRIYFQRTRKDGGIFLTLQNNLYKRAFFIVDEASMIAGESINEENLFSSRNLLDDLIEYTYSGEGCKLILIGDTAQLPPVGTLLSPALDLEFLKSRYGLSISSSELTEVMRQAEESGILANATMLRESIRKGVINAPKFMMGDFNDVERLSGYDLEDYLSEAFTGDEAENSIVVTRSNKRANIFNQEIRKRIIFREYELEGGDLLMVVRNNYYWLPPESEAGFIANGDIVELVSLRNVEDKYGFRFADVTINMVDYEGVRSVDVKVMLDTLMGETANLPQADMRKLFDAVMGQYDDIPERRRRIEKVKSDPYYNALQVKFAYAMTCHKTQGGQWEKVFIDQGYLPANGIDQEYLRWLYTAITRATGKVYFVNFKDQFFE